MAGSSWLSHVACSSLLQKVMGHPYSFDNVLRVFLLYLVFAFDPVGQRNCCDIKHLPPFSVSVLLLLLRLASLYLSCLLELLGLSLTVKITLPNFRIFQVDIYAWACYPSYFPGMSLGLGESIWAMPQGTMWTYLSELPEQSLENIWMLTDLPVLNILIFHSYKLIWKVDVKFEGEKPYGCNDTQHWRCLWFVFLCNDFCFSLLFWEMPSFWTFSSVRFQKIILL